MFTNSIQVKPDTAIFDTRIILFKVARRTLSTQTCSTVARGARRVAFHA